MSSEKRSNVPVKSVDRSLRLLEQVKRRDAVGVSALAAELDAAKSTVHNHLLTLERHGFVAQGEEGTFRIGYRLLEYSTHLRERDAIVTKLKPEIERLARKTGEICTFLLPEREQGVVVLKSEGEDAVSTELEEGTYGPIHAMPGGKALLPFLPELLEELMNREQLSGLTSETITTPEQLESELDDVLEQRYALNDGEYESGMRAVSVPMVPRDDTSPGAVSIIGPADRLRDESRVQDILEALFDLQNRFDTLHSRESIENVSESMDERLSFWTRYGASDPSSRDEY